MNEAPKNKEPQAIYNSFDKLKETQANKKPIVRKDPFVEEEKDFKMASRFFDSILNHAKEKDFKKVVNLIETGTISKIVLAGDVEKGEAGLGLDNRTVLMLLRDYCNKKDIKESADKAEIIPKDSDYYNPNHGGISLAIGLQGIHPSILGSNNNTVVYIDNNRHGKDRQISEAKKVFDILKAADILKQEPWLKSFIDYVDNVDNLEYLNRKDRYGNNIFNESYFENTWTRSLAAFAPQNMDFQDLVKLFKEGKIGDPYMPFTNEDLKGEIGDIKVKVYKISGMEILSIRDAIQFFKNDVRSSLKSVDNIKKFQEENGIVSSNEYFGEVVYQNYKSKFRSANGREILNTIKTHLIFPTIKAVGANTYVSWNKEKGTFFINSDRDLEYTADIFNKKYKKYKCSAVEKNGRFIFGKIGDMREEDFLEILNLKDHSVQKSAVQKDYKKPFKMAS